MTMSGTVGNIRVRSYNGLMSDEDMTPAIVNRTVPPRFTETINRREREWLTPDEVGQLLNVAGKHGRNKESRHRNKTMILVSYRHGLRPIEACHLKWSQFDFESGSVYVKRVKGSRSGSHPIGGEELRALRQLQRDQKKSPSPYLFMSERRAPMTPVGFYKMLVRFAKHTKIPIPIRPYMLRHACGNKLNNDGWSTRLVQDYLGHVNIQNTVRYTVNDTRRYNDFWDD